MHQRKENSLEFHVGNSEENLGGVSVAETINTRETILNLEFKKQKVKKKKEEKENEKRMDGKFIRETMEKVDMEKTCQWLSGGDLKVGTEALLLVAQEQAIRTNYMKYHIDKAGERALCRLCGENSESMQHITSGCEKLAQKYKRRHDNVAKKVHCDICKKKQVRTQ